MLSLLKKCIKQTTLIKKKVKLSSYMRKFRWDRLQSHIWGRLLIPTVYEEMRKYLTIYEEAVSHIWLCTRSLPNFLIHAESFIFFFISELWVHNSLLLAPAVCCCRNYHTSQKIQFNKASKCILWWNLGCTVDNKRLYCTAERWRLGWAYKVFKTQRSRLGYCWALVSKLGIAERCLIIAI